MFAGYASSAAQPGQRRRLRLRILIKTLQKTLQKTLRGGGRPHIGGSGSNRLLRWRSWPALTLRAVFRLACRQVEGLICSIVSPVGLTLRVPDHTTVS